jgi:alkylated DNA repair dioxygenase AlkB
MKFETIYTNNTGAQLQKATQTLKSEFASTLLAELQQLSFTQEFGRGTAWLGEHGLNYIYAGRSHIATGYTPKVEILTKWLNETTSESFNHILVNQYKPGQKLNKHKDDEKELKGSIASLSLGAPAVFDYTADQITLHNGELIIGNREFFNQLAHGVSTPLENSTRYNITWRTLSK